MAAVVSRANGRLQDEVRLLCVGASAFDLVDLSVTTISTGGVRLPFPLTRSTGLKSTRHSISSLGWDVITGTSVAGMAPRRQTRRLPWPRHLLWKMALEEIGTTMRHCWSHMKSSGRTSNEGSESWKWRPEATHDMDHNQCSAVEVVAREH